jgi:hypothetical protein
VPTPRRRRNSNPLRESGIGNNAAFFLPAGTSTYPMEDKDDNLGFSYRVKGCFPQYVVENYMYMVPFLMIYLYSVD